MYHDLDDIYVTVKVLMYNVVLYDAAVLVMYLVYRPVYKNVLYEGLNDLESSKWGRQWISHPKISIKRGITLAYRAKTKKS